MRRILFNLLSILLIYRIYGFSFSGRQPAQLLTVKTLT